MKLKLLIDEPEDVRRLTEFLEKGRSLSVIVDTDARKIHFADEGQMVSYFVTADLTEDNDG